MNPRRLALILCGLFLLVFLALLAWVKVRDYGPVRASVRAAVESATGRALRVGEGLHLELGLEPVLVAPDVRLAGKTWGSRPDMIRIKRVEAGVALFPLLLGRVRIRGIHLVEPEILIEQNSSGRTNLDFRPEKAAPEGAGRTKRQKADSADLTVVVHRVTAEDGLLTFREVQTGKHRVIRLDRLTASAARSRDPIDLSAQGAVRGKPFQASGTLGSLADILTAGATWKVDITAHEPGSSESRVRIRKTVRPGPGAAVAALRVTASSPSGEKAVRKARPVPSGAGAPGPDARPVGASDELAPPRAAPSAAGSETAAKRSVGTSSLPPPQAGDLEAMLRRERIRVLVCYDHTDFFIVHGEELGFEYEMISRFGKHLNRARAKGGPGVSMIFLPLPCDRLLDALAQGRGDIAAPGPIPPGSKAGVALTEPYLKDVSRIFVTHRSAPAAGSLEDLAGRTVHLPSGGPAIGAIQGLNRRLRAKGLAPLRVVEVKEDLVTEDLYEMVHAGIFSLTVGPEVSARLWSKVFTDLVLLDHLSVGPPEDRAWAVRKDSPDLLAALNDFVRKNRKGSLLGNILFHRYFESTRWIRNPLGATEQRKLDAYKACFRKYARQYGLDWLTIAAQAYQESGLDPNRRSAVGAVGLMQLMPDTAAHPPVSIPDITNPEDNVHAGVKYMSYLLKREFADPALDSKDRYDFALAAYNAGPGRVHQLRRRARAMGLDPNRWFGNVERAALAEIGRETVQYVANIRKYALAYHFAQSELERRSRAR